MSAAGSWIPSRSAARHTSAGSPTGSAAAKSNKRRASFGRPASRRVKFSSMLADRGIAAGRPNPPASSVGVSPLGNSSSASGFPPVSTTILSSTSSSSRAGKTDSNSARASRCRRGEMRSSGRPLERVVDLAGGEQERDPVRQQAASHERKHPR